ncbi:MAG: hypothetical protein K9L30_02750 [Desulfobacterales bacterium]|nr:hypothetical protein [Desulfobacterales bacterium]
MIKKQVKPTQILFPFVLKSFGLADLDEAGSPFFDTNTSDNNQIDMRNSSDIYGAEWGKEVIIHHSGNLYYDEVIRKLKAKSDISYLSWLNKKS